MPRAENYQVDTYNTTNICSNTLILARKPDVFSGNDMQDGLWENYQEDLDTSLEWEEYVRDNATNYLDGALFLVGAVWGFVFLGMLMGW